ncbi:hypothetical protein J2T16_004443 [Paenibacillus intestini]|nr:hypothetical protein [Paenibacillus intestini]
MKTIEQFLTSDWYKNVTAEPQIKKLYEQERCL